MGASEQRPTSNTSNSGGSGFYENILNQQNQAVADQTAADRQTDAKAMQASQSAADQAISDSKAMQASQSVADQAVSDAKAMQASQTSPTGEDTR